jgi:hypothetical protein
MNRKERRSQKKKKDPECPIQFLLDGVKDGGIPLDIFKRHNYPKGHIVWDLLPEKDDPEKKSIVILKDPKFLSVQLFKGNALNVMYQEPIHKRTEQFKELIRLLEKCPVHEEHTEELGSGK